jgi:hypothetical protein
MSTSRNLREEEAVKADAGTSARRIDAELAGRQAARCSSRGLRDDSREDVSRGHLRGTVHGGTATTARPSSTLLDNRAELIAGRFLCLLP